MKAVLWLTGIAMLLVLLGGIGTIGCFIAGAHDLRIHFMRVLIGALFVSGGALVAALVVGVYHLYLRAFTSKKPTGFFSSEDKEA